MNMGKWCVVCGGFDNDTSTRPAPTPDFLTESLLVFAVVVFGVRLHWEFDG